MDLQWPEVSENKKGEKTTARNLKPDDVVELEDRLGAVLLTLTATEGEVDVESEFETIMFSKSEPSEETYVEIREMSKRFGPSLMRLLGFPAAPGVCEIQVKDNCMQAALDIDPPTSDGLPVTAELVRKYLADQKIVFGIDDAAIAQAVETGRTGAVHGVCIARGTPMEPGEEGRIEAICGREPPPGMELPKDMSTAGLADIETVAKDQKIARLIPPTPGKPGKDVFGWEIAAKPGSPLVPQVGENVSFDAHANLFHAKSPGRVAINKNFIDIEKLMLFKGDIDIAVGHVIFPGEVMVRGWVRSGLSVQAEKDIVIEGGVEAAMLKSKDGSIFISKGIQGSGLAMVQAGWDVTVKFVEQATVLAGGVLKTQSAVNSELAGGECVKVLEGRGVVIGGKIYAGDRAEIRELGAGSGESTTVQLGVTAENLLGLTKLKSRLNASQKALTDAELALARFGLTSETLQSHAMTEEGRQLLKLAKTVIVLHSRLRKIQDEEEKFLASMKTRTDGILDVHGRVHPGVRVLIGHAMYLVTEPISSVRFKYDASQRRIKAIPLI